LAQKNVLVPFLYLLLLRSYKSTTFNIQFKVLLESGVSFKNQMLQLNFW